LARGFGDIQEEEISEAYDDHRTRGARWFFSSPSPRGIFPRNLGRFSFADLQGLRSEHRPFLFSRTVHSAVVKCAFALSGKGQHALFQRHRSTYGQRAVDLAFQNGPSNASTILSSMAKTTKGQQPFWLGCVEHYRKTSNLSNLGIQRSCSFNGGLFQSAFYSKCLGSEILTSQQQHTLLTRPNS
jgi:hypothetical protein